MKVLDAFLGLALLGAFCFGAGSCASKKLQVGREIGAPLNRAQVAANPEDMDRFLAEVQSGMETNGYTSGHWQPFNQNNDNDFAVAYTAVKSLRQRLVGIKSQDTNSTTYQVALADLRGTIRELHIGQQSALQWHYWWIWPALILGIVFLIVAGWDFINQSLNL